MRASESVQQAIPPSSASATGYAAGDLFATPGLSPLDSALAHLAARLAPTAPTALLLTVALVSRSHACGHTALDLSIPVEALVELLHPGSGEDAEAFARVINDWYPVARSALMPSVDSPTVPPFDLPMGDSSSWSKWDVVVSSTASTSPIAASIPAGLLVWAPPRLYLNRVWQAEHRVATGLHAVSMSPAPQAPASEQAERLLQAWFPGADADESDQKRACLTALTHRLTVITGGPGSGKTHTAARLLALLQACREKGTPPLRMALAAPTGKAAARLRHALQHAWSTLDRADLPEHFWQEAQAAILPATTVHSLLGPALQGPDPERAFRPPRPLNADLVLVDEASMLDLGLMEALLSVLPPKARLVLIGDRHQLASVEAGSVLADTIEGLQSCGRSSSVVELSRSRRFAGDIARWAQAVLQADPSAIGTLAAGTPEPSKGSSTAQTTGAVSAASQVRLCALEITDLPAFALGPEGAGDLWDRIRALRGSHWSDEAVRAALQALERFRILCAVRQGPWGVDACNRAIEQELSRRGWAEPHDRWYHGQVVMITRNNPALGLYNGDVGLVLDDVASAAPRFAWLDGQQVRHVACSRLANAQTAFAMTVHKSQGSEFERLALVLPGSSGSRALSRELLYTGITRARQTQWILGEAGRVIDGARRATRRMGGLKDALRAAAEAARVNP